jgi:hypothetical protein
MSRTILDDMEYSSDALAQAAYISDASYPENLLIHFDGSNGQTTYTAETGQTVSFVGTAQLDSAIKKFGTTSLLLDGNSDYVSVPDSADWDFGTGDFTIDLWIYATGSGLRCLVSHGTDSGNYWLCYIDAANKLNFFSTLNGNVLHQTAITASALTHVAVTRQSGVVKLWTGGVVGTTTKADIQNYTGYTGALIIGQSVNNDGYYQGNIDELRIIKGTAFWTSDFTPNTVEYYSNLQVLSESTIKTQGSYSLKGIAAITNSLNKALIKTLSSPVDLSNLNSLRFDIYSSRTGSNIKIGIHDSGGVITEITPNITSTNSWKTVEWNISAVSNANKNVIDSIIITIVNADADNTFYIDFFESCVFSTITIQGNTSFTTNNILRMKDGTQDEWIKVQCNASSPIYCVERDLADNYAIASLPAWKKGTAIVNYRNSGDGMIYMTASDPYAPYIDVLTHQGSPWNSVTTTMRMGNLNGFLGYTNDAYGIGIGDSSASLTYDCVNGMRICSSGSRTVFDGYGIKGYDACNSLKLQICNGHIEAQDIKLQDPNCNCNYSYLEGGALRFHDQLGDRPYVKRICSGTVNTGYDVVLNGWVDVPQISVSIKTLMSYNSCAPTQCQKWDVYADPPICYYTSSACYGYCFKVHAVLTTYGSIGVECVKDVNFDVSTCTDACVCASTVRLKLQLWCNDAAPSCYYYGTLCYALCYRVVGAGAYCACCYCYVQPHGSVGQMQSYTDDYRTLAFPCMATWEILAHQVCLAWTNSGVCASGVVCCVCCRAICNGVSSNCIDLTGGHCCCVNCVTPLTISGTNPTCVYYNAVCFYWCSVATTHLQVYDGLCAPYACAYIKVTDWQYTVVNTCLGQYTCCFNGCCSHVLGATNCYSYFCVGSEARGIGSGGNYVKICHCVCGGYLLQCYCVPTGLAACCVGERLYSLCNSYGCYTVLDPNGVLNWIAIAYA